MTETEIVFKTIKSKSELLEQLHRQEEKIRILSEGNKALLDDIKAKRDELLRLRAIAHRYEIGCQEYEALKKQPKRFTSADRYAYRIDQETTTDLKAAVKNRDAVIRQLNIELTKQKQRNAELERKTAFTSPDADKIRQDLDQLKNQLNDAIRVIAYHESEIPESIRCLVEIKSKDKFKTQYDVADYD
ncbi:hypothetical protein KRX11_01275 [Pasteurellaceae bacterium TAE3-ERU1]|nr:hypothetical protein [Pasteurellaceae bacterium TAE3-ERU1]